MNSTQRREARYRRRVQRRAAKRQANSDAAGTISEVFSYSNMFWAGKKCCNGVRWKQSTQNFEMHLFSGTAARRRQILDGTWKPGKYVHFTLRERGKIRPIDAPHITDRQAHKVLRQEILEPLYAPSMIYDNGASLRGKGLEFHYNRLKKQLREHYRRYGREGVVFLMDFHHFFPSAPHDLIFERHRRLILDPEIRAMADTIVGAAPGPPVVPGQLHKMPVFRQGRRALHGRLLYDLPHQRGGGAGKRRSDPAGGGKRVPDQQEEKPHSSTG